MSTKQLLKKIIPEIILQKRSVRKIKKRRKQNIEQVIKQWKIDGSPIPPPHEVKQFVINEYREKTGYKVLIETGTYYGAMIDAQKDYIEKIYSIELSEQLYANAIQKYKSDSRVVVVQGDSSKVLNSVISQVNKPSIFWLDGHYSYGETARGDKDCPIFGEIDAIFNNTNMFGSVLLIDDARCFNGTGDYPTIDELKEYVYKLESRYKLAVESDIICFYI